MYLGDKMDKVYSENFVKTIYKEDYERVMQAIREVHNEETGWIIGEVMKEELPDGRLRITVPLTKKNEKAR